MYFCYCILMIIIIISIKLPEMLLLDENLFLRHLWSSNFGCASADCYGLLTISLPTSAKMSWFSYEDFQPLFNWFLTWIRLTKEHHSYGWKVTLPWVEVYLADEYFVEWGKLLRVTEIRSTNSQRVFEKTQHANKNKRQQSEKKLRGYKIWSKSYLSNEWETYKSNSIRAEFDIFFTKTGFVKRGHFVK